MKVYYEADPSVIRGRRVAIIGYGSQGHAHALNLSESGVEVRVGVRNGSPSGEEAKAAGLAVLPIAEASEWADVVMVLIPDQVQKAVYESDAIQHFVLEETGHDVDENVHWLNVRNAQQEPFDVVLMIDSDNFRGWGPTKDGLIFRFTPTLGMLQQFHDDLQAEYNALKARNRRAP